MLLTMPLYRHPKKCYNMLKSLDDAGGNCWATKIRTLLYKYGFSFIWISQDVGDTNAVIRMFKHRVVNYCSLDWHAALYTSSICDHYINFKSLLTVETYLTMDIQLKYRIAMSTFRLSNHRLNIDLCRYNNVLKENRICNVCQQLNNTNVIDCEYHAFLNVLNMILLDKCIYLTGIYMVQKLRISMLFYLLKTQAL